MPDPTAEPEGSSTSAPAGALEILISHESGNWPDTLLPVLERAARAAWNAAGDTADGELSVALVDDDHIRQLNRDFRGQDKPTNVLSFPADDLPDGDLALLGDIVLAAETLSREATEQNKSLPDHLSHLTVHGMLHLLGYDHEIDADAEEMEQLERDILQTLDIADPYADTGGPV